MARGHIYTVEFNAVAVTAASDLFELTPADDKSLDIIGIFVSQYTDFGDAQDELCQLRVVRGFTSSGTGGSTSTPRPLQRNGPTAGFACEINNTGLATTGTTHNLLSDAFNVRAGYALWLPEGCGFNCTQADTTIVVRMTAPVDSLTMNGTLFCEEH